MLPLTSFLVLMMSDVLLSLVGAVVVLWLCCVGVVVVVLLFRGCAVWVWWSFCAVLHCSSPLVAGCLQNNEQHMSLGLVDLVDLVGICLN